MSRATVDRLCWAGLALAALAPRLAGALLRHPWHDEYFTAWAARLPFAELLAALRLDSGPPLPYLMVKLVAGIGIPSLAAARAVSVAAGTAAVVLAARAARRAFGPAAGWWTGAFLAAHPLAVAWSCEGRAYALMLLAAAWAWERIETLASDRRGAVGLGIAVALACWSHGLGLLLAAVLAAVALALPRPLRPRALVAVLAGLASSLPWLPVALRQPPAAIAWMADAWRAMPVADRLVAPVRLLSPLGAFASALDLPSSPLGPEVAAALALAATAVAGWCAGARRAAVGAALPPAALGVLAVLGVPAFYPGRGDVLAIVPLVLLVGAAAGRWRLAAAAAMALLVGGAATSGRALAAWATAPPSGEQRIAASLRQALPGGGTVVIGGYWRLGVAYHLGDAAARFTLVNVPSEAARHPGWYDPRHDTLAPEEVEALARRLLASSAPVAVVATPGLDTAPALEQVAALLRLHPALAVPGGVLFLPTVTSR